jgi:hypothetical protein
MRPLYAGAIALLASVVACAAILNADCAPVPAGMSPCVLSSCTVDYVPLSLAESARMNGKDFH